MTTSRTNPTTRDAIVLAPTTPVDLMSDRLTGPEGAAEEPGRAARAPGARHASASCQAFAPSA